MIRDSGFDPNAINGFPSGGFNPNHDVTTVAPPPISGGDSPAPGNGFNPNAGQWTTSKPPR